jgi:hypothetical protein
MYVGQVLCSDNLRLLMMVGEVCLWMYNFHYAKLWQGYTPKWRSVRCRTCLALLVRWCLTFYRSARWSTTCSTPP